MHRLSFLLVTLGAGGWLAAQAQVPPAGDKGLEVLQALLDTKVSVASKTEETLGSAPGVVTVISRLEIEGFAGQTLGQALNRVVGTALLSPDIFVDQSVVIRGQETTPYNNHVLVLLNGRPMRDPVTGGLNGSYWNAFPIDAVERIEIIRGPGSVLYGSCAFSGVINVVTRAREEGTGGQAAVTGGSQGGFGQSGHLAFQNGHLQGIVALSQFRDSGPTYSFVDYQGKTGSGRFSRHALGVVTHLELDGLTLNAYQGNFDPRTLEGGSESWTQDTKMQQITTHADAGYSMDLGPKVTLGANVTFNRTAWYTGNFDGTAEALVFPPTYTEGRALLFEATAKIKPADGLNAILGGGEERSDWGQGLVLDGSQRSSFLYAQVDYRISSVKLVGGMQYNKLEDIKGNTSPRLGIIVDLTPETGLKVMQSSAFRKGYPNETGFNHPVFRGNPDLQPERIRTFEAQLFHQTETFQGALTYYQSRMQDIITRQILPLANPGPGLPPFYFKYLNGGSWDFSGVEAEGCYRLTARLLVTGNASYQTNKNEAGITGATLHPNTMVKAGLLYTESRWSLGVFDAYFGKPKRTTLVRSDSAVVNPEPKAHHLLSAKVIWKVLEAGKRVLKLSAEGQNLLDRDIRYPDYPNKTVNSLIPLSAGRTLTGSISCTF